MAFLVTGPILDAHVLAKSGVSSRSVSWFTLEWFRRPTRCPRAPFAKQSRCQSQENAGAEKRPPPPANGNRKLLNAASHPIRGCV